jgi:hypothetical protein
MQSHTHTVPGVAAGLDKEEWPGTSLEVSWYR